MENGIRGVGHYSKVTKAFIFGLTASVRSKTASVAVIASHGPLPSLPPPAGGSK
jgi:hypothetical protein